MGHWHRGREAADQHTDGSMVLAIQGMGRWHGGREAADQHTVYRKHSKQRHSQSPMCTAPPQTHLLLDSMMMSCLEWGVLESAQINLPLQLLGHS